MIKPQAVRHRTEVRSKISADVSGLPARIDARRSSCGTVSCKASMHHDSRARAHLEAVVPVRRTAGDALEAGLFGRTRGRGRRARAEGGGDGGGAADGAAAVGRGGGGGVPEGQANVAKYCLCATADDIVQNIPTEDRHVWTQYSDTPGFLYSIRRRHFAGPGLVSWRR